MGNVCCGGKEEGPKSNAFQSTSSGDDVTDTTDNQQHQRQHLEQQRQQLSADTNQFDNNKNDDGNQLQQQHSNNNNVQSTQSDKTNNDEQYASLLLSLRKEQGRLEQIVQNTSRTMVSVRSTRGSTGYYDQGFAAALWQHLQQSSSFETKLVSSIVAPSSLLPPIGHEQQKTDDLTTTKLIRGSDSAVVTGNIAADNTISSNVYEILSQPMWDNMDINPMNASSSSSANNTMNRSSSSSSSNGANSNSSSSTSATMAYLDHMAEAYLESILPQKERVFSGSGPIVESLL